MSSDILLLGDPRLRLRAEEVRHFTAPSFTDACRRLSGTLEAFRAAHGFGRAISAPQLGIPYRLIAANLGKGIFFLVNPVVTWESREEFTMWDDCMSFPDLLVRLSRARSVSIEYSDENGTPRKWTEMELAPAELFQHEIDHLDGILAVDRAEGANPLVMRSVYEANREAFDATVDYTIDRGVTTGKK